MAAVDLTIALAVARAVRAIDSGLVLVGLANSKLIEAGKMEGLQVVSEAFADRRYLADGSLVPRTHSGALYHSIDEARAQVTELLTRGYITAITGETVPVQADTICVHGDGAQALQFAKGLALLVTELGIKTAGLKRS